MPGVNHNKYSSVTILSGRSCSDVFVMFSDGSYWGGACHRLVLQWIHPRRFSIQASITPLWALFSWTCGCRRFPFPSAVRSSLPLHFECKRAICTYLHYVYVLLFICWSLIDTSSSLRVMLKGVWELVWKRLSVLRTNHSCHQLSAVTDDRLQSLKWIWSLQLFDICLLSGLQYDCCMFSLMVMVDIWYLTHPVEPLWLQMQQKCRCRIALISKCQWDTNDTWFHLSFL